MKSGVPLGVTARRREAHHPRGRLSRMMWRGRPAGGYV